MAQKTRKKTAPQSPPAAYRNLANWVQAIGAHGRAIRTVKAKYDDKIDALRAQQKKEIEALEKKRDIAFKKIVRTVLPKWGELVNKGKRTIELATGTIQARRAAKPRVIVKKEDEPAVTAALEKRGRHGAVRIKKEVNKSAIQDDPALAEGIRKITLDWSDTLTVHPTEGYELKRPVEKISSKI